MMGWSLQVQGSRAGEAVRCGWCERGAADRAQQAGKKHGAAANGGRRARTHQQSSTSAPGPVGAGWRSLLTTIPLWAAAPVPSPAFFVA